MSDEPYTLGAILNAALKGHSLEREGYLTREISPPMVAILKDHVNRQDYLRVRLVLQTDLGLTFKEAKELVDIWK